MTEEAIVTVAVVRAPLTTAPADATQAATSTATPPAATTATANARTATAVAEESAIGTASPVVAADVMVAAAETMTDPLVATATFSMTAAEDPGMLDEHRPLTCVVMGVSRGSVARDVGATPHRPRRESPRPI